MKYVESIETDKVQLEVYECDCGFHIGIDFTYLDQEGDVTIPCPVCGEEFDTEALTEDEEDVDE